MFPSDIARSFLKQFYRSTTETGLHWYTPESLTLARRLSDDEIKEMHRYIGGQFANADPDYVNAIYRYVQDLASNESSAFQRWMEFQRNGVAEGGAR